MTSEDRKGDFLTNLATTVFGVSLAFSIDYAHRNARFKPGNILENLYHGKVPWHRFDDWVSTVCFSAFIAVDLFLLCLAWKWGGFRTTKVRGFLSWAISIFVGFLPWLFYWVQVFLFVYLFPPKA